MRMIGFSLAMLLISLFCTAQSGTDQVEVTPRTSEDYTFRIYSSLTQYTFHVRRNEDSSPIAIEVSHESALVQVLEIPDDVDAPPVGTPPMGVEDVNGDGYADLKFLHWWGASGNHTYFYWLFDKDSGKFIYETQLAELPNVMPDPKTHEIRTHSDSGAAGNSYTDQVFRFEGKNLILVREVKQEWNDTRQCFLNVVTERAEEGMQVVRSQCVEVK
jgi:hypothetical protein